MRNGKRFKRDTIFERLVRNSQRLRAAALEDNRFERSTTLESGSSDIGYILADRYGFKFRTVTESGILYSRELRGKRYRSDMRSRECAGHYGGYAFGNDERARRNGGLIIKYRLVAVIKRFGYFVEKYVRAFRFNLYSLYRATAEGVTA